MSLSIFQKNQRVLRGLVVFFILIFFDLFTKYKAGEIYRNYDFAFSLKMPIWLMYSVYFVGIGLIIFYLKKNYHGLSKFELYSWVLIFSGAILNVSERLILGFVRDWIYIANGVFNLADIYIILGILILFFYKAEPKKNTKYDS